MVIGCTDKGNEPDVSKIKIDYGSRRLDIDLAQLDTNAIGEGLAQLKEKYPDFLDFYLDTLKGFGINGQYVDTAYGIKNGLRIFLTHHDYRGLFDTVIAHYPDTKDIDKSLIDGFKHLKYYFHNAEIPRIVYLISGLDNYAAFTYDSSVVGIGLDMYLGDKYPFYTSVGIPKYMTTKFQPNYIPINVFQAIYRNWVPFVMEGKTLLDMMMQRGVEQYFLEKMLPTSSDTARLGFTKSQMDWCNASEAQIYNFFITEKLLYETNWQKIVRYVNDGPMAAGMPKESPGNVGSFLGLQIVKAYIAKHPQTSLAQLMQIKDGQIILQQSQYKPK